MAGINRYHIRVGDKTTHGGTVIGNWSKECGHPWTIFDIDVACIGDYVTCPLCKGTHQIVQGDNVKHRQTLCGRVVASTADFTTCGASLLASQNLSSYTDESWVDPIVVAVQTRKEKEAAAARALTMTSAAAVGAAASDGADGADDSNEYTAQFIIIDEKTGKPADVELAYCIVVDDGDAFVDKAVDDTTETQLVNRDKSLSVEMLVPIQFEMGV
ncbi:MAG: PAAR domain-containing protein [Betaproteobacteria bacterium]|nr:PAAR domain-containing protein [Betaproteobacteria bacterium]